MSERQPTADELAGLTWWNAMTEPQRADAMRMAKAKTVAQAWQHYKSITDIQDQVEGKPRRFKDVLVTQEAKSWSAGYAAGHSGKPSVVPPGADSLAFSSGLIEGQADRAAGRVRPATRKPPPRTP